MNPNLLRIYHRLPPGMRNLGAGIRGSYLRHYRYGAETDRLVEEALERENWSEQQWNEWREDRLSFVLHRAATRVPYYREQWAERRRHGDRSSWEYLENWPVLEKEPLRQNGSAFVADDCDTRGMFRDHTSGTTGKSLNLWMTKSTVRYWYALAEARWRKWYGVSRADRWAILGGQLVTPVAQTRPPFWVWNRFLKQLYMSSYHLSSQFIPYYLDALRSHRIEYLLGYTSSLYELAQVALQSGQIGLKMKVVITNAEPVFDYQRTAIEQAFGAAVRETYGMAEMVTAASECQAGSLHLWPEAGIVETLDNGQAVNPGSAGELICTGLINADMPLIRYRNGDRGALSERQGFEGCACGRTLPILASVEGRTDDILIARDGRRIGRLDPIFKEGLPVREAQVVQESIRRIRVRYVPADGYSTATGDSLVRRLRDRMGPVEVTLEEVESIPRTSSGKFRAVVCLIPVEERQRLAIAGY